MTTVNLPESNNRSVVMKKVLGWVPGRTVSETVVYTVIITVAALLGWAAHSSTTYPTFEESVPVEKAPAVKGAELLFEQGRCQVFQYVQDDVVIYLVNDSQTTIGVCSIVVTTKPSGGQHETIP